MPKVCGRLVFLLLVIMATGCPAPSEDAAVAEQRMGMGSLARAYGQYMSQNRGRIPSSEESLRKFIEKQGPAYLESLRVDSIDDLFVSPRDNQPYVVLYGKKKQGSVVAYEAEGVDGTRFIAHDLGGAELLDEAKFKEMVPDAE